MRVTLIGVAFLLAVYFMHTPVSTPSRDKRFNLNMLKECLLYFDENELRDRVLPAVIKNNMCFYDVVDEVFLGPRILDEYGGCQVTERVACDMVAEAFMSSILKSTPRCTRICMERRQNAPRGHIFYATACRENNAHPYDKFRVDIAPHLARYMFKSDTFSMQSLNDVVSKYAGDIRDNDKIICLVFDAMRRLKNKEQRIAFASSDLQREQKINFESYFSRIEQYK